MENNAAVQCFIEKKKSSRHLRRLQCCRAVESYLGEASTAPSAPSCVTLEPSPHAPVATWLLLTLARRGEVAQVDIMPCFLPQHGRRSLPCAPPHPL